MNQNKLKSTIKMIFLFTLRIQFIVVTVNFETTKSHRTNDCMYVYTSVTYYYYYYSIDIYVPQIKSIYELLKRHAMLTEYKLIGCLSLPQTHSRHTRHARV